MTAAHVPEVKTCLPASTAPDTVDALQARCDSWIDIRFIHASNLLRYGAVDPTGGRGAWLTPIAAYHNRRTSS